MGSKLTNTDASLSRQLVEQAEAKAIVAIESAALGTYEIQYATDNMITSDRFNAIWGIEAGLSRTEIAKRVHPEDRQLRQAAHAASLKTGNVQYEARVVWEDQTIHWVQVRGKVLFNRDGSPDILVGVVQDITEQKLFAEHMAVLVEERTLALEKQHAALLASEERYHKMVAEVEDYAIVFLDTEGLVQNWNKGAEKIKGYREDEIVGKSFRIFYLPEDRERRLPESLINLAVKEGKAVQEGYRLRKDGTKFWGSIVITALHDAADNVVGFSKVTRDLTVRKEAEDKIRQYTRELEFQNDELRQFAFAASHDMKEPIRKILYNTNYLKEAIHDRLNVKELQALSRSADAAKRMKVLIDDILSYAQIAFSEQKLETVDLNELLNSVLADMEELINDTKARIVLEGLPVVHGAAHQLNRLFGNLINNAIKYSHADRSPVVVISSEIISGVDINFKAKEYHKITVQDNGIGFDDIHAEKIFDLFYRIKDKAGTSGSGIGLFLCRKIVQDHNGVILAKSTQGTGTLFEIYLPVEAEQ